MLLALAMNADLLVIDDRDGRREATRLGLPITGTAGVVVAAKRAGSISSARDFLERLVGAVLFLGPSALAAAFELAGESDEPS